MIDSQDREDIISECLDLLKSERRPVWLPENAAEAEAWRKEHESSHKPGGVSEDAWFELYDLAINDPETGWSLLLELISRCHKLDLSMIAAGPLGTFLHHHAITFSERIENELAANPSFRDAYHWTMRAEGEDRT